MASPAPEVGAIVRLLQPADESEREARYVVVNVNRVTGRAYIELICDEPIRPQELVRLSDIEPTGYDRRNAAQVMESTTRSR